MGGLTTSSFRQKFRSFLEQYELRELHFQALMRTKECEVQYNLARYEQQRKEAESQAKKSQNLTTQVSTFSQTETELRSQLNIYVEKFKQVSLASGMWALPSVYYPRDLIDPVFTSLSVLVVVPMIIC